MHRTINKSFFILLTFIILFLISATSYAQTVRGRLVRNYPYGQYPAVYVMATLSSQQLGRSAPAYTGEDGMYYFYNVPPGQYNLEIWGYGTVPMTFPIVVNNPITDIFPTVIP